MKILVIGSGGREHALCWKLSHSPKCAKLYCAPGNGGISEVAELVDIKSDDVNGLLKFAKDNKIDLVHAHTRVSQVASYLASRRAGIPYVATCHGYFNAKLSRRLFDTWGEKVVAISEAVRAHLEKDFNVASRRIEVIYNGIDLNRFSNK